MTVPQKPCHAFSSDVLGAHDAVELAALIKRKELSASEVMQAALARCEKVNPTLNAVESLVKDPLSLMRASSSGVFAGVPTFIKDNLELIGVPTSSGSPAVPLRPAVRNDPFVDQYLSLGIVPLGKSRLPEFGLNASTEYKEGLPARNPWNTDYSVGASSGGSAALVAAGVVPIAHANDGGGSIRIPASCAGLVGLKPSFGRLVGSALAKALPIKLLAEGVLTRSVRDTAHFLYGSEQYYRNPKLPAIGLIERPLQRSLRIAMLMDSPTGHPTDPQTKQAVAATAKLLEGMGHRIEAIPALPFLNRFTSDFSIYWGLLAFSVQTFGPRLFGQDFDPSRLDGLTQGLGRIFRKHWLTIPVVLRRLAQLRQHYAQFMKPYDLILSPVLNHPAPPIGYLTPNQSFDQLFDRLTRYVGFTPLNNVTGTPALSLPLAQSADGLPLGVHFSARYGEEKTLVELAFALEEAKPWPLLYQIDELARASDLVRPYFAGGPAQDGYTAP